MQIASDYRNAAITALGLALVSTASVMSSEHVSLPASSQPRPEMFAVERALEHVRMIATQPHPGGTPEHARVREYLMGTLRRLHLEATVQEGIGVGTHNSVAGRVSNVIARIPGQRPGGPSLLLVAHYDGVPGGPAAADDAAGVAVVLEAVRALRTGPPTVHDIIVLFSDGEEAGLTGAAAFVQKHAWATDVGATLNFDSGGATGPTVVLQTGQGNLDLIRGLRDVPGAAGSSLLTSLFGLLPYDTDVSELNGLAAPAMTLGFAGSSRYYHTASDNVGHLDGRSVQHQGELALRLARSIADGPLPLPRKTSAVFFTLPALGMIAYSERVVVPLACVAALLVAFACIRPGNTTRPWPIELAIGFAGVVVATMLSIGTTAVVGAALDRFLQPTYLMGWTEARGGSAIGIALVAVSVATACWRLIRHWISERGAQLGAFFMWLLLALLTSWRLQGASFLFVLPLLGAAIAAVVGAIIKDNRVAALTAWAAALIGLAVVTPAVYELAVVPGMGVPGAVVIGLFVPLTAWLLATQLEVLALPRRFASPLVMAATGLVGIGVGIARAHLENPRLGQSMLAYALDADSGHAWLVSPARLSRSNSWAASVLGPSRIAVGSRAHAGSETAAPSWLRRAIAGEAATLSASAPRLDIRTPSITVVTDSARGRERQLKVHIQPAPATYSIRLRIPGSRIGSAMLDGHTINGAPYRGTTHWSLGYVLPPDEGFDITLVVKGGEPLEVELIARSLGLPTEIVAATPSRFPGTIPVHAGDQTVVHRLTRL